MLELIEITVQFGALKAVDGVSIALKPGERRAIIGPNGAGKTTLFNAITGTTFPGAGRILFCGTDITRMPPHRRAHCGITRTFQITNLFGQLTVLDNMRLSARGLSAAKFSMFGVDELSHSQEAMVRRALAATQLEGRECSPVRSLSHGEQRQLELAMALAVEPRLLLLDEPAAGLSPNERRFLSEIIRNLPENITLILIEHDMDLALGLVDYVTVMHNGKIIAEDEPESIRKSPLVQEVYLGRPHGNRRQDQGQVDAGGH